MFGVRCFGVLVILVSCSFGVSARMMRVVGFWLSVRLLVVRCLLFVVCYSLLVVRCLLFVAGYVLLVGCL